MNYSFRDVLKHLWIGGCHLLHEQEFELFVINNMAYFSKEIIDFIWKKAKEIPNYNPSIWRKDFAGAWIRKDQYGIESKYGWEIDHLKPRAKGGTDDLNNLLPIHWLNNRTKSDDYPKFKTSTTSEGNTNIEKSQSWEAKE